MTKSPFFYGDKMEIVKTANAPSAIGTYSQAVIAGDTVYVSGQIGLDPFSMELVSSDFKDQAHQTFKNLKAVIEASGSRLEKVVKLNISVTDLSNFSALNDVMSQYFQEPYPARAAVEVKALPKGASVEIEAICLL